MLPMVSSLRVQCLPRWDETVEAKARTPERAPDCKVCYTGLQQFTEKIHVPLCVTEWLGQM